MMKIYYKADYDNKEIEFEKPSDFVGSLLVDDPELQDEYEVFKVTINDEEVIDFEGKTILDLFKYYWERV
ncbi:hypothetical protein [Liquorilactobacillus cacaonum]|uniref:DUF4649 domain-containing protein n=1 Tax=Liquorilactobacillus cacaonum DSM 21116 TaxID=1423729 RepID=A0A0R2CR97_9LACO|nr:hypothetical protein [Liquorilactobacillus cacaonum]KRM90841.1 hypothetical protein FC80_GL000835 [Liquorilactobacillus cacaonum DSM 21116]